MGARKPSQARETVPEVHANNGRVDGNSVGPISFRTTCAILRKSLSLDSEVRGDARAA